MEYLQLLQENADTKIAADPQFDTGTLGSDILYLGNNIEDGAAVMIYGIVAAVQSIVPLIIFMVTTITPPGYLPIKLLAYIFIALWAPVFLSWLAVVIFDSKEMRVLMKEAVHISAAGPFLLYWVGLGDIFMNAIWADWGWWVTIILMVAYSIASICYAAIFVPKVVNWLDSTPIKEYPAAQAESAKAAVTIDEVNADDGEEAEELFTF